MRHSQQNIDTASSVVVQDTQAQRVLPLHQRLQAIRLEQGNAKLSQTEAMRLLWGSSAVSDSDPWNRLVELEETDDGAEPSEPQQDQSEAAPAQKKAHVETFFFFVNVNSVRNLRQWYIHSSSI